MRNIVLIAVASLLLGACHTAKKDPMPAATASPSVARAEIPSVVVGKTIQVSHDWQNSRSPGVLTFGQDVISAGEGFASAALKTANGDALVIDVDAFIFGKFRSATITWSIGSPRATMVIDSRDCQRNCTKEVQVSS